MRKSVVGAAALLLAGAAASASPVLQFDVNSFNAQYYTGSNASGSATGYGGLGTAGSFGFSLGSGILAGMFRQNVANGPFVNQGSTGVLSVMTGYVNFNSSNVVTGGTFRIGITNGDYYNCVIAPGSGTVSTFVGGGFKIEALTNSGFFFDAPAPDGNFGNVNVTPWLGALNGFHPGSFLEFNFNPNSSGLGSSDMDAFVDVAPLPPAAWAGLATLAGVVAVRRLRRR